jgi:4-amino-4-deoxy-L-arabinose transferase-like glycosyltransferase
MNYPNYRKLEEFVSVMVIIFSGFVVTAVMKLNNFFTFPSLDEMLWHYRSSIFWDKILSFDFSGLIQSAQPGITVYWFTGFMMKFIDFDFNDVMRRIAEKEAQGLDFNHAINDNNQAVYMAYETISFAFNVPLILLTAAFFISFYYLIRKLGFNRVISSFALLFLTTNVFLAYWNTPSDKMLNIFMTLSFLTILVYINKLGSRKYLYLSAVFGAWAVLSKLSAFFILPFYLLIFVFYARPIDKKKIKLIAKDYLSWILIFVVTSIIFLPTIITNSQEVYSLVFKSEHVIEKSYEAGNYANRVVFDYLKSFTFVIIGYMAQASSMSLFAYFIINLKKEYRHIFNSLPKKIINTISLYIVLFFVMVTLISKNHDIRFMSPAFVVLNIISAVGLYGIFELIAKKIKLDNENKKIFYTIVFIVVVLSQIIFITSSGQLSKRIVESDILKFF